MKSSFVALLILLAATLVILLPNQVVANTSPNWLPTPSQLPATPSSTPTITGTGESGNALRPMTARGVPKAGKARFVPGRVVVKWKPDRRGLGAQSLDVQSEIPALDTALVRVAPGDELAALARLRRNPNVAAADLDYIYHASFVPNDPFYGDYQWNMRQIDAPGAWDVTTGSNGVVVAVLDTGADRNHPDLAANLVPGWNFTSDWGGPNDNTMDNHGHGTHVSGIVAAVGNNGTGVAGMAWNVRVMPLKVLDSTGSGSDSDVARAVVYAVDRGVRVINLSLGGPDFGLDMQNALDYARSHGAVVIAAAGNNAASSDSGAPANSPEYPAAYPPVIAVGATDSNDQRASFSNYAAGVVDLTAPGVNIPSTGFNPSTNSSIYYLGSGTSQATPHVAGLAALLLSINPALTPDQIESLLESTAVDLGPAGKDDQFGYGRINAASAVRAALASMPTATPTPTPTSTPTPTPTPEPALVLSNNSLMFLVGTEGASAPQQVDITINNGAHLPWSATTQSSWVRVNNGGSTQGTTPGELTVAVDTTALPSGTFNSSSITVSADVAQSPQIISVSVLRSSRPLSRDYLPIIRSAAAVGW